MIGNPQKFETSKPKELRIIPAFDVPWTLPPLYTDRLNPDKKNGRINTCKSNPVPIAPKK